MSAVHKTRWIAWEWSTHTSILPMSIVQAFHVQYGVPRYVTIRPATPEESVAAEKHCGEYILPGERKV